MRVPNVVSPALAAPVLAITGPPLAAWGGYGLGVGLGCGVGGPLWTGANLLAGGLIAVGGGAGLAAAVLGRSRSVDSAPSAARSFAADAAALDAFAPAVVRHPRGAAALKALAELLFEVHHPANPVAPAAVPEGGER